MIAIKWYRSGINPRDGESIQWDWPDMESADRQATSLLPMCNERKGPVRLEAHRLVDDIGTICEFFVYEEEADAVEG